jgi:serine/threonine-protein kinase
MRVPEWLVGLVYKCLEKDPSARFVNGMDLHQYIVQNRTLAAGNIEWGAARIAQLELENERLKKDNLALAERLTAFADAGTETGTSNLPGCPAGEAQLF